MMRSHCAWFVCAGLLLTGGAAAAQNAGLFQPSVIAVEATESLRPVRNAPFIANTLTTSMQTLADGNRIERRSEGRIARDSAGRVRREQQALVLGSLMATNQIPLVTISDATAGVHLTINDEMRVVHRLRTKAQAGGPAEFNEPIADSDAPAAGPGMVMRGATAPPVTTSLGEQQIEGLHTVGTRTTSTINAGAIGNALPIKVVTERWYSLELQTVVRSRRVDPRFGETVFELSNVVRAEPSASEFEIPAGYRVEEIGPAR